MSIADGKDCRNWLKNPEEYLAIKEKKRLLTFQIQAFGRELKREQRTYAKLMSDEKVKQREKAYNPRFRTREELDEAYVAGLLTDREYMRERYAIWLAYSDRGHINNMKWLESEIDYHKRALEALENHIDEKRKASYKRRRAKWAAHLHKNVMRRRWYKKQRAEGNWWRR